MRGPRRNSRSRRRTSKRGNERSNDTKHALGAHRETVPAAPMRRGEDFVRDRVEHAVPVGQRERGCQGV